MEIETATAELVMGGPFDGLTISLNGTMWPPSIAVPLGKTFPCSADGLALRRKKPDNRYAEYRLEPLASGVIQYRFWKRYNDNDEVG
jgi:hypothetical protein